MKLATIEKVLSKSEIEGADKIELVNVLGWQVITKKNEFQIGDYCIYIPIDTTVNPLKEYFAFLKDEKNPETRVRIKTKKLRGVFSQGLVLPVSVLDIVNYSEGQDVSELIDVQKYEKENIIVQQGSGTNFKPFPTHIISITDEDNLKTMNKCLKEFYDKEIYITLKMDGSSMTIIKEIDEFTLCSRRLILEEGSIMYQYVNNKKIKERIMEYNLDIAIQGEFCGPKVNGNQMQLKDYEFYVFNIKNIKTKQYYGYEDILRICKDLNLKTVPLLSKFVCDSSYTIEKFQQISNDVVYVTPMNKKVPGEGIVIRPIIPIYSPILGKMLSCKVINQNYKD